MSGQIMTGLEAARWYLDPSRRPGIGDALDVELLEVGEGFAACGGVIGPQAMNSYGVVHGGYIATLLDTACSVAVLTKLGPGFGYTTIELKVSYVRAIPGDIGRVRAEGTAINVGRRIGFSEAKLLDATGNLLATASSSVLVIAPLPANN